MPEKNQNYVALIGDLVASRALAPKERAEVQKQFKAVLERVNKDFKSEITSLFLITAGDETQGILKRPDCCYEILRQIQMDLASTEIVFGLGFGTLTTDIGEYAIGADGPAFHLARQALNEAKGERKAYGKSILREVRLLSEMSLLNTVVDALFLSVSVLKSHWTDKQTKILNLLEQHKGPTEIAELLKIPASNVSRTIESSQYREYEFLVSSLESVFKNWYKLNINNKITKK